MKEPVIQYSSSDLVTDKRLLKIKQDCNKLINEMRQQEFADLLKKERIRCRKLIQQTQD
jgi:hypothetical protein